MSSDVHLMAADYSGAHEWAGSWAGSWDGSAWQSQGYYDEYGAYGGGDHLGGGWELFDVDLNRMVFCLDESLNPADLYKGLECDDKSLIITLEAADVSEKSPAAWRSRPLKIHPEPAAVPPNNKHEQRGRNAAHAALPQQQVSGGIGLTSAGNAGPEQDLCVASTPALGSPAPTTTPTQAASRAVTPTQQKSRDANQLTPRGLEAAIQRSPGPSEPFKLSPIVKGDHGGPEIGPAPTAKPTVLIQSPKIVLSNSQLEDLKQKMNILKQKRISSPMDSPSGSDDKFSFAIDPVDADLNKPSSAPVGLGDVVYSNCPGKHGLRPFDTPDRGWWCSVCETEFPKGAAFYGCRACDYDECEQCAKKEFVKGVARRTSPQTTFRSPPAKKAAILTPPPPEPDEKPSPQVAGVESAVAKASKVRRRDKHLRDRPVNHVRRRKPPPSMEDEESEGNSCGQEEEEEPEEEPEEEEEESPSDAPPITTAKTLRSRREAKKARGRRLASETPERWEPRAARRGEVSEARQLRGRHRGREIPNASTKVKITRRKRAAAPTTQSASNSPSDADTSSSEKHLQGTKTIKQKVRDTAGKTPRLTASENRKHVANSPSKNNSTKASSHRRRVVGDETPPSSRRLVPAADRRSSGSAVRPGGRPGHLDLLQKVLRANSANDPPRRSGGAAGRERASSIRDGGGMADGAGATRTGAASLKPSSGERSGGPRKAFEQITSQLEKKSRRA